MKIVLSQINPTVGDVPGNSELIIKNIELAEEQKTDIIVFPELAVTGYPPEDLLLNPTFINKNIEAIEKISSFVDETIAVVGFVSSEEQSNNKSKLFNSAAVIHKRKIIGVYCKNLLPNYAVFDEKRYFTEGEKAGNFNINGINFMVTICEDIWDKLPEIGLRTDLIINLSASPFYVGKIQLRNRIASERAKENKAFLAMVNLIGGQDELVFDGSSTIMDRNGEVVAKGKSFEEDLVIAEIGQGLTLHKVSPLQRTDLADIYNALILGTRDYVRKNNFEKVLIGLSGGIDSSVTAAIAVAAIGSENVIGVSMPSIFSSEGTKSDAKKLAKILQIKSMTVPINKIFDLYRDELTDHTDYKFNDEITAAEENIQARIRGSILMALSNKLNYLVLATGNKSEVSMGYCTLYGDMVGGFSILKDVPKTVVYELAKYINNINKTELIPQSIISRDPSAELRKDQKDVDTLPPYEILDPIIKAYVEEDKSMDEIVALGFDKELVKNVVQTIDKNEYKRRQSSPGIKITPRAFGKDRRYPLTNQFKY